MKVKLYVLQRITLLFILFFLTRIFAFSQQVAKVIPNSDSPEGIEGFLEFRPSDYGSQKHPLIIFLHGIGERGDGTTQINNVATWAIPYFCAHGATMRFTVNGQTSSFVTLSPQLSTQLGYWPPSYVKNLIAYAKANLQIDTNRIYLTGLSLGGGGVWRAITDASNWDYSFDSKLAAAAPVCGTQEENDATFCGTIGANHLPIWAFHSMDDGTVGVGATQHAQILANMCGVTPAPKFTYYQTGNHSGAWINAFDTGHITTIVDGGASFTANPNLYEWLLSNTRATTTSTNTPPVANAGNAQSVTLPANSVNLTGTGSGTGGATISSYAWVQTSGPSGSSITGSNAAAASVTGLVQGNYVFTLTVTDNHGLTSSSSVTITVLAAPVAVAGPSQVISATSTVLNAAASYSPNGSITSYTWQQVSGPAAVIANATSAAATVSDMALGGTYEFQLTVTDIAGASGSAVTNVTVSTALPVQLTYFTGVKNNAGNLLQWETATEQNNDYFLVERSTDGSVFTSLNKVAGAGNSSTVKDYTYTDTKAPSGDAYYRLTQVDKDGRSTVSSVILITGNAQSASAQMYPNPVQDNLAIMISNDVKGNGNITVYDLTGRMLKQALVVKSDKLLNASLNMSNMAPGMYIVQLKIGGNYSLSKSIMKK